MTPDLPYVPGHFSKNPSPLARFLPPIPEGIASSWLKTQFPETNSDTTPWILDPFGSSPLLIREIAETGFRVLVAANNPVARFIIEMTAHPPMESQLRAALSELAASYRGEERIEPHIKALYESECANCGKKIQVEAFLWERGEPNPFAKIYTCPFCGDSGNHSTDAIDIEKAKLFSSGGLHRARALERIVSFDDPDRHHAEEAIDSYLPRAIYILFTLINKLDAIPGNRDLITALLLSACDQATSLWPYPSQRSRPKLLTIPTHFRENNIWMLLDKAVEQWAARPNIKNIPVCVWPELPPLSGGICLFEGRIRELSDFQDEKYNLKGKIGAVISAIPRPNQAFWTLSALWAGWLWGRTSAAPFKSVLRRHRYDWSWHCSALFSAFESTLPLLKPDTPIFGLLGEVESGLLSSALVAANTAGFILENIALRKSDDLAQVLWFSPDRDKPVNIIEYDKIEDTINRSITAAVGFLKSKMEPSGYLHLLNSCFMNIAAQQKFGSSSENSMWELHSKISTGFQKTFTFTKGFIRYGGSEHSLDVGQWWLRDSLEYEPSSEEKLPKRIVNFSDSVEVAVVNYLLRNPRVSLEQLDIHVCSQFPGLMTPDQSLVKACLTSYAIQASDDTGDFLLRVEDKPDSRKVDISSIYNLIHKLGKHLGFRVKKGTCLDPTQELPLLWISNSDEPEFIFFIQGSALLHRSLSSKNYSPKTCILIIPGGRSGLIDYKLKNNPLLNLAQEAGWRFLKFRLVRAISEQPGLTREKFTMLIQEDPITKSEG